MTQTHHDASIAFKIVQLPDGPIVSNLPLLTCQSQLSRRFFDAFLTLFDASENRDERLYQKNGEGV
jgi:hypothetical protein